MKSASSRKHRTIARAASLRRGHWVGGASLGALMGCNAVLGIDDATLCAAGRCEAGEQDEKQASLSGGHASPAGGEGEAFSAAEPVTALDVSVADAGGPTDASPCSVPTPVNFGAACGSCGGSIDCSGSCSVGTPSTFGQPCGSCGGSVSCDGSCSVLTPAGMGTACGSCGGTMQCNGTCSVPTPSDYGSLLSRETTDSFSCCIINQTRSYGPDGRDTSGCYPGYAYAGCTVTKLSGLGRVTVVREDPTLCICELEVQNTGLDGATYSVDIRLTRACNAPVTGAQSPEVSTAPRG
jgi:hypothetical protein